MSVALFSLKPVFAEAILRGEKRFEFRTKKCSRPLEKMLIYATKPKGLVVGEARIAEILTAEPAKLWQMAEEYAGISRESFLTYFKGHRKGYAYRLILPRPFDPPLSLAQLGLRKAPQSYCYLDESLYNQMLKRERGPLS